MSDQPNEILTEGDITELLGGNEPSFHPILRVWREVLAPAVEEMHANVTPQWATRIIQSYTGIGFADMNDFRDAYFGKVAELARILELELEGDDDALTYGSAEEDNEHNAIHYKNLLLTWQQAFLQWELDWDTTSELAAVEVAAISEVHKMFFGPTGIVGFLDNIKFEFTDADQAQLVEVLNEMKQAQ